MIKCISCDKWFHWKDAHCCHFIDRWVIIYRFDFNYFSDFKLEDGIILKAEQDYFALIGRNTTCHWIAENIDNLPEEIEEFEDNDLDFEMM